MTRHSFGLMAIALAGVCIASIPAAGQGKAAQSTEDGAAPPSKAHAVPALPSKPTPRTADGHPDFSGMWITAYAQIRNTNPRAPQAPEVGNRYPYQPWAAAKSKELYEDANTDPLLHCLPYGEPRVWGGPHPVQFIQTPGQMAILYEKDTTFRVFPTDGRPHLADADPSYMGDSTAHWDGDTLVVDVTNFNDKSWLGGEGDGSFHSDAMHVIERITRPDMNNLNVELTIEDSKVFSKAYTNTYHYKYVPDEHFYEDVTCSNEKDYTHIVPGGLNKSAPTQ